MFVLRHLRKLEKQSLNKQNSKLFRLLHGGSPYHTETSQLFFTADRLTGFLCAWALRHEAVVTF